MHNESNMIVRGNRQPISAPPQVQAQTPAIFYLEPAEAGSAGSAPDSLVRYMQLLRRNAKILVAFGVIAIMAAVAITGMQSPTYRASTTLEIMSLPDSSSGGAFERTGGPEFTAESYIQTQVRVLESRKLRDQVNQKLSQESRLWHEPKKQWEAWAAGVGLMESTPAIPISRETPPKVKLTVTTPPNTRLIEVVAENSDADYATQFANTLVQEYTLSELEARWDTAQRNTEWLTGQLSELKGKLTTAESALRQYDQSSGLLLLSDNKDTSEDQLGQMLGNLMQAQAERIAKQSLYEMATRGATPGGQDNQRVSAYRLRLTDLRQRLAELSAQFTAEHPRVKETQAQIDEVEAALKNEQGDTVEQLRADYEAAARREELLAASYREQTRNANQQANAMLEHTSREREVDSLRGLYDELYRRVREAGVASASNISSIRIVDEARVPERPFSPQPVRNLALCLTGGLFLGITFVVGRDWIRQSLSAPGETPLHLGVPELGIIPEAGKVLGSSKKSALAALSLGSGVKADQESAMQMFDPRFSAVTESFRNVVASILAIRKNGQRPRVILATSASHGDGKSTAVGILAASLAEVTKNVVLIDGDLRKPSLHKLFDVPNDWGLSDVLRERTNLKDMPVQALLRSTDVPGLHLLTSGPGTASISNLLYSNRMEELVEYLRGQCDTILIDAPPLLAVSDARILGQYCDGAVMVIRAGKTTRDEAAFSAEMLRHSGVPLIGTILNRADPKSAASYGYYGAYDQSSVGV